MAQKTIDLRKFKSEDGPDNTPQRTTEEQAKTKHGHTTYFFWEAPEYDNLPKNRIWFISLAFAISALAVFAFWFKNYFFAIFIVIAGFLAAWFAKREPRKIHFAVTSDGVQLGGREYLFDDLKSFWIFYDPPLFKELSIESKKALVPRLTAPLGDADPERVRQALIKFLPEEKQDEPLIAIFSRLIGF